MIKIEAIASLITKDAKVIDIGTDHAYLPIYLYNNDITKNITGTDISSEVLKYSKKNLEKYQLEDKIKLVKSDGFKNIYEEYDEAVIAGMGANTIINILKDKNKTKRFILNPHNKLYEFRKYMYNNNYKLEKEIVIKERNKYYNILKYIKGQDNLDDYQLLVGISNNYEYIKDELSKYKIIYEKSKLEDYKKYIEIIEKRLEKE